MPGWLTDWLAAVTVLDAVLMLIAAAAVITALWKAWPWLLAVARGLVRLDRVMDAVLKLPEQIEQIHHETHHNNGTSLKDSAARTEATVDRLETALEDVTARLERLEGTQNKETEQ